MLISALLCICICLSFIFDGYMENIFIVLAVIAFYKQIIINKEYKYMCYAVIISIIGVNCLVTLGFRDYIKFEDAEPAQEREETLILLVSEGESKNYNLRERATQVAYEYGNKSYITATKDLYNYKRYYSKFGSSNFKENAEEIASKLRSMLGNDYKVVNSYLYSSPYFESSLEGVISKGFKKIILCPLFMTEGVDYNVFKDRFDTLNLSTYELKELEVLDTFYKSSGLAMMYKNEILEQINKKEEDAGVLLVGLHDKNNLEQDIQFRETVRNYILQEEKNKDIQIKLPLLENNKHDIVKSGEELLEYGIDTLYVALTTCTIDTMYSRYLVESILKELDMGNTKFYYIDPKKKLDILAEEIFIKISLIANIGG